MPESFHPRTLFAELVRLQKQIPGSDVQLAEISPGEFRKLRAQVAATDESLRQLLDRLDRVRRVAEPFNPASPDVFAEAISNKLLLQAPHRLSALEPFYGSGVYALFYRGPFRAYAPLRGTRIPIYAGKANPKDSKAATVEAQGTALYKRLAEHIDSISEAEAHPKKTLKLADFDCRFLILDSAWQVVSENYLIRTFRPIWNKETKICTGIGKHGDAFDTRGNRRSAWDTLHPGRAWATSKGTPNRRAPEQIIADVLKHCEMYHGEFFASWGS